ncbi:hypothetical protein N0V82_001986 [Gnomoniopsis sp. IMI 355080]|nr:hypothetical protein N0V82_001986 [Gnomoniopsis sp. IMI 355080]
MENIVHLTDSLGDGRFPWQTRPSPWQQFRRDPSTFLIRWLYKHKPPIKPRDLPHLTSPSPISLVCISDTHCSQPNVPDGDVLLHAGDLTNQGTFAEIQAQLDWLNTLPHRYKVAIAGNHDSLLDPEYVRRRPDRICEGKGTARADLNWGSVIYLNNSSIQLHFSGADGRPDRKLKIFGSPWTEQFGTWAFQYPPIRDVWSHTVPDDTDVLLVHGPPKGHLDLEGKGCPKLLREIRRVQPRLVVFGHIHAGHGRENVFWDSGTQGAYDMAMMGDARWGAVVAAIWWTVWEWVILMPWWGLFKRRNVAVGTLVNAAMLVGRDTETMNATVINL